MQIRDARSRTAVQESEGAKPRRTVPWGLSQCPLREMAVSNTDHPESKWRSHSGCMLIMSMA